MDNQTPRNAAMQPTFDDATHPDRRSARRLRRNVLAAIIGGTLGLAFTLVFFILVYRQQLPELTRDSLDRAQARWDQVAPDNYNIEIRVEGRQPAVYRVEVRGGTARRATRNGEPLPRQRTLGTWSVPGMFATIDRDVKRVERINSGGALPGEFKVFVRALFDPYWGFPARYHRIESGAQMEVFWEVTHFDPHPPADGM